tara:strand:- start:1248 stop:1532 length:285 start_codon:yes stop_codon:yes gene_type:complete
MTKTTIDTLLEQPDGSNFWEWVQSPEFEFFMDIVQMMLLEENSDILERCINLGEETSAVRLGQLTLIHRLKTSFPRSSSELLPAQVDDLENPVS